MYKGIVTANVPDAPEDKQKVKTAVQVPENFKDCIEVFGSESNAVALLNQKYKIDVQNKLRREHRVKLGLIQTNGGGDKSKGIQRA